MSGGRHLSNDQYLLLKTHTRRLIKRVGGLAPAAKITRVQRSQLSDYENVSKPDCFMPADVIADLESFVGESVLSQTIAELALSDSVDHSPLDLVHRLGRMAKEVGEALSACANGDSQEAIKEIDEAIAELEGAKRDILARQCRLKAVRDAS